MHVINLLKLEIWSNPVSQEIRAEITKPILLLLRRLVRRFRKIARSDFQLRHVCPSVRAEQLGPAGRIFMKIDMRVFFQKSVEKIHVLIKSHNNYG
jgi:hypothetical protein